MKTVWFVQNSNSMQINEVFTTKKAVIAETKRVWGRGRFHTVVKGFVYSYFTPDDKYESVCVIEKVPVIHTNRNRK